MLFIVEDLLSQSDLVRAQRFIDQSRFIQGAATAPEYAKHGVKNNKEMEVSQNYLSLVQLLDQAVDLSPTVNFRVQPRFRSNPIVNRYDAGMFYDEHIDAPIQGGTTQFGRTPGRFGQSFMRTDFSMTLFLSDPASYDGGELELKVFGDVKGFKLRAGSAVCYATGIPHSVKAVSRGSRIAAVYWFQSLIRSAQVRDELWEQYCLERDLRAAGQLQLANRAANVRNNLMRYLAEL